MASNEAGMTPNSMRVMGPPPPPPMSILKNTLMSTGDRRDPSVRPQRAPNREIQRYESQVMQPNA